MIETRRRELEEENKELRSRIEKLETVHRCLREEFLLNTENYPDEYHKLFQKKFKAALEAAEKEEE